MLDDRQAVLVEDVVQGVEIWVVDAHALREHEPDSRQPLVEEHGLDLAAGPLDVSTWQERDTLEPVWSGAAVLPDVAVVCTIETALYAKVRGSQGRRPVAGEH